MTSSSEDDNNFRLIFLLESKKIQFGLYDPFLLVIPLFRTLHSLLDSLFVLPASKVSFDELFETIDDDITKSFQ